MTAPNMTIAAFKSVSAGALIGFADVRLPSGMILHGCAIFKTDGKISAAAPAKPMIGRDGTALRTAAGKTRYEPTVSFADRPTQDRWSAAVIAALRAAHPEVLT